ncbi:MAG: leucyl aminopeptidase [Endozoicomonas sp. (ex Botrylloides leachii)]|nr:leucyl aminopeptidase [Endozoicomonas sp. (ex Botrylloides leachii)]
MEFVVKSGTADKQKTACLVVAVDKTVQSPSTQSIDKLADHLITMTLKRGDMSFKTGETLLLPHVPGALCERLLMVATDKNKPLSERAYKKLISSTLATLKATNAKEAVVILDDCNVENRDIYWVTRQLVEVIEYNLYQFDEFKSKKTEQPVVALKKITLLTDKQSVTAVRSAIYQGKAIANGRNVARTLGNLPSNICHPTYLADQAKALSKQHQKLTTKVLNEKQMAALGMHSLLSVSAGSDQEAKLIIMEFKNGKKSAKPTIIIGKGITFDSGGISLKPSLAMDEMKFDMCGSASVFGVMNTIIELDLPVNVVGIVAAAENMPGGKASRPGDIVKSMSGQTIEILNTDAEGRLVLCDALTYAERYKPEAVIDIATLTGACIIALGHHNSGLLSNNDNLSQALLDAAKESADKAWLLPMGEEYQEQLDSNFADMANIGGRAAGTITAACFLSRFAKNYPWAHLDVAGTASFSGKAKGASGRPVPMLVQYLLNKVNNG